MKKNGKNFESKVKLNAPKKKLKFLWLKVPNNRRSFDALCSIVFDGMTWKWRRAKTGQTRTESPTHAVLSGKEWSRHATLARSHSSHVQRWHLPENTSRSLAVNTTGTSLKRMPFSSTPIFNKLLKYELHTLTHLITMSMILNVFVTVKNNPILISN